MGTKYHFLGHIETWAQRDVGTKICNRFYALSVEGCHLCLAKDLFGFADVGIVVLVTTAVSSHLAL